MFLILQFLIPAAIAAASGVGNFISGAQRRQQQQHDIAEQNKYNSPAEQLKRLREAGLPYGAFESGQAGTQSALPEANAALNNFGSESLTNFMTTHLQLKQIELLDAQIKNTQEEAQGKAIDNQVKQLDPFAGEPVSYAARKAKLEVQMQQLQYDMSANRYEMEKIDYEVKKSLNSTGHLTGEVRQRVANMWWSMKSIQQAYRNTENATKAFNVMIEQLEKGGMSVGEAFIHSLMTGGIRNFTPMNFYGGDIYGNK